MSETHPDLTNKVFTKEKFNKLLTDYLASCPSEESAAVADFLGDLYSINIHSVLRGDAIDAVTDKIDISTGSDTSSCLGNFLITTRTRAAYMFSDMSILIDNHLVTLGKVIESTSIRRNYDTLKDDLSIMRYIVFIRIYLDLELLSNIQEKSS